jgi:hypothetical protein
MRLVTAIFLCLFLCTTSVWAQQNSAQKSLGSFGTWQAFSYKENDSPVCYMVKAAKFPTPKNAKLKRGATYLMITHRPGENNKDVVSYAAGYNFRPSTDVDIVIGKDSFNLFTNKDTAWSRDPKTDHALATAIRNNLSMKISAVPAQANMNKLTDSLDITGSAAAYQAIGKACGYEADTPSKPAPAKKKKTK